MLRTPANWDLETDLICVGSGLGSITAAIAAHDRGKKTLVLEKAEKAGGVSACSGGQVWLPDNHKMAEEGMEDSIEKGRQYLDFLGGGFNDPQMLDSMLKAAPEALVYLEKNAGVKWRPVHDFPDYYYPHVQGTVAQGRYLEVELFNGPDLGEWQDKTYISQIFPLGITHVEQFEWGGFAGFVNWDFQKLAENMEKDLRGFGSGLMAYMVKAAFMDRGIPAYLSTPVKGLVIENGRVTGVRAEKQGKDFFIKGKAGVILGIGGYDYNSELTRYYEDMPEWRSMCQPTIQGDNIILGAEIGASIARLPSYNIGTLYGYHIPGEEHPDGTPLYRWSNEGCCPHALWVNEQGERFCDETFYKEFQSKVKIWDGLKQKYTNYPPIVIFDGNYRDRYPVGTFGPGDTLPEGLTVTADTLRDLAEKLNINADTLEKTVQRFNKFCEEGKDRDFNKGNYPSPVTFFGDKNYKNPVMGPVNKPPFSAIRLVPVGFGVNSAGLKTNIHGQVMHVRGHAIEGLYAVGNSAAPLDTGAGYQSGLANMRGIAWGWISAHHAIAAD